MGVVEAGDYGLVGKVNPCQCGVACGSLSCCGDEESHQTHGRAIGSGLGKPATLIQLAYHV